RRTYRRSRARLPLPRLGRRKPVLGLHGREPRVRAGRRDLVDGCDLSPLIRPAGPLAYERMFDDDLSAMSKDELERELRAQAAHVDAALCRLTELAAECEERLDWGSDGVTFAHWLAWQCSLMPRVAREHERIGRRLGELPLIGAAFARGELSY